MQITLFELLLLHFQLTLEVIFNKITSANSQKNTLSLYFFRDHTDGPLSFSFHLR